MEEEYMLPTIATEFYNHDLPDAKYKRGDEIVFVHNGGQHVGHIVAVNDTGEGIEYFVQEYPWALWESEVLYKNVCVSCGQRMSEYPCAHCGSPQR